MESTKINKLGLEFVQKCVEILVVIGLDDTSLFQNESTDYEIAIELLTNGLSKNNVNRLKCLDDICSSHVSLSLKLYFQYLQNPLFPETLFNDFIKATSKLKSEINSL